MESTGKDVEKENFLHTASGDAKWCRYYGKYSIGVPQKFEKKTAVGSGIFTIGYACKNHFMNSFIAIISHNCQDMDQCKSGS